MTRCAVLCGGSGGNDDGKGGHSFVVGMIMMIV